MVSCYGWYNNICSPNLRVELIHINYMSKSVSIESTLGIVEGIVVELDNGNILIASENTNTIKLSIDAGASFATVYYFPAGIVGRGVLLASNGYVYFGSLSGTPYDKTGRIVRSVNGGASFDEVLEGESSGFWYFAETSNGDIYAAEYSAGLQDANELYGYNVWRSVDYGSTWQKFFSAPAQSTPGAKDSIRHIHVIAADSNDNLYATFGETKINYGSYGGETRRLNPNGTIGNKIAETGNGWTAVVESDKGDLFWGNDADPVAIYKVPKYDRNSYSLAVSVIGEWGSGYDTVILSMTKGHDGVLYAVTNGTATKPSVVIASVDDGESWLLLKYTTTNTYSGQICCNPSSGSKKIYVNQNGGNYRSFRDYTRAELRALYTSTLTIKTS